MTIVIKGRMIFRHALYQHFSKAKQTDGRTHPHRDSGTYCFSLQGFVFLLQGFLRIESVDHTEGSKSLVGRRFIAVRGPTLCVYKEEKDFVDDAPFVELEMKLACIKVRHLV